MASSGLAEHVERFLRQYIDSVEQLEVLLFLRQQRGQACTPAHVARELRIDPRSALTRMEGFAARGLLVPEEGGFRYAPNSSELDRNVDGLSHAYAERRVTVINLIFSKPSERITSFADAFRFDPKKGGR